MEYIYQIKKEFVKNNTELEILLNKFGKLGWDIFSCVGYQKLEKRDEGGFYYYETEYTIMMKKPSNNDK